MGTWWKRLMKEQDGGILEYLILLSVIGVIVVNVTPELSKTVSCLQQVGIKNIGSGIESGSSGTDAPGCTQEAPPAPYEYETVPIPAPPPPAGDLPVPSSDPTVRTPKKGSGSCSPYDPYVITTIGELQGIQNNMAACYTLGNDIDATGTVSWDGGRGFKPITGTFTGQLQGAGKTVTGLTMKRGTVASVALFERIDGGTVNNVQLNQLVIEGKSAVAAIAVFTNNQSSLLNSTIKGTIRGTGAGANVGGAVVYNSGTIGRVTLDVTVAGRYDVGGLVSNNDGGYVYGIRGKTVVSTSGYAHDVGGVIGYNDEDGFVNDMDLITTVTAGSQSAGGLIGGNAGSVQQARVSQTVAVDAGTNNSLVGGLVGNNDGTIRTSRAEGSVSVKASGSSVGGLVGLSTGTISHSVSTGTTYNEDAGWSCTGGLIGAYNRLSSASVTIVEKNVSHVSVTRGYASGGFVGCIYDTNVTTIRTNYSTGTVQASSSFRGGFAGYHVVSTNSGNYWDKTTSGLTTSAIGIGKTTTEMRSQGTFSGWNFTTDWQLDAGFNGGRPSLVSNP